MRISAQLSRKSNARRPFFEFMDGTFRTAWDSGELDEVERGKRSARKLLQPRADGKRAEIDRREPEFFEHSRDRFLRCRIVARKEQHATSAGLARIGAEHFREQRVHRLDDARARG